MIKFTVVSTVFLKCIECTVLTDSVLAVLARSTGTAVANLQANLQNLRKFAIICDFAHQKI